LKISLGQLKGELSKKINQLSSKLLDILAIIEANIDFPEEEISPLNLSEIRTNLSGINKQLQTLLEGAKCGQVLREGIHVVICGRPNVGKSSLLNALLKNERSIVTPLPGTTRDTIEEVIDIKGIPIRIVDTAGIVEPRDLIEKKAIARSQQQIDLADLVLLLFDGNQHLAKDDLCLIQRLGKKTVLAVINKIDLPRKIEKEKIHQKFSKLVEISAKKNKNIPLLEDAIADLVYSGGPKSPASVLMSSARHIQAITKAQKLIAAALHSLDNKLSAEFVAQDLKEALGFLDDILGRRFAEGLLAKIFSEFCIGK
jgi:tRNA modification GTPase